MNLSKVLGADIEVLRNKPLDSMAITIRKPNGVVTTAVLKPDNEKIETTSEYLSQGPVSNSGSIKSKIFKILNNIFYLICGILAVLLLTAKITGLGDAKIVMTGSMVPAINPGDMIFTVNDSIRSPKINDVVVYEAKRFNGEVVAPFAHRIIGGNQTSGWIMKGDANEVADIQRPKETDIKGVVFLVIPILGNYLNVKSFIFVLVVCISLFLTREILRSNDD